MILYHGSDVIIKEPKLIKQNRTLDFVSENRNGKYSGKQYDIIYGPVANDTIYRTFVAYEEGLYTKEETVKRLKVKKLYNQMTFTSREALAYLKYTESFCIKSEG